MFNSKKQNLFRENNKATSAKSTTMKSTSPFVNVGLKNSAMTTSLGNGAVKYTTTGSDFVDQFGKITNYRKPRSYSDISSDMSLLWSQNPQLTVALTFYIRMITRKTQLFHTFDNTQTEFVQRGQGLKHEGIFRMIWLATNQEETFWKNLPLFLSIGSWKDIFTMLSYDLQYHGWGGRVMDWNKFGQLILVGLENPNFSNLLKKYLPQIKANSKCKTLESQADNIIAKWIVTLLFGSTDNNVKKIKNYKKYRKLKTSGDAHTWQQLISQRKFLDINFNTIHGRALALLVSGKFLENQGLETEYQKWIESKPVAKFTGYVYELFQPVKSGYRNNNNLKKYQIDTINKQFYSLIETAKDGMNGDNGLIVVVDSSSSMTSNVQGLKVSAYDVAKSMALYFSFLLKGSFEKAWMEFDNRCSMKYWVGETPVEMLQNDNSEAYGSTNFQSIANEFGNILSQGVSESEFPSGILCVSDGCFNSTNTNQSNFKELKHNLLRLGFSKEYVDNFKVILWDIPNGYYSSNGQTAFEDFADTPNLFHLSGLDGSAIAFLNGSKAQDKPIPKNSDELFLEAMNQEVLNLIEI